MRRPDRGGRDLADEEAVGVLKLEPRRDREEIKHRFRVLLHLDQLARAILVFVGIVGCAALWAAGHRPGWSSQALYGMLLAVPLLLTAGYVLFLSHNARCPVCRGGILRGSGEGVSFYAAVCPHCGARLR